MAVFVRFLDGFWADLSYLSYFSDFYLLNILNWQIMDNEILKKHQAAKVAVFWQFLCGFWAVFGQI